VKCSQFHFQEILLAKSLTVPIHHEKQLPEDLNTQKVTRSQNTNMSRNVKLIELATLRKQLPANRPQFCHTFRDCREEGAGVEAATGWQNHIR
jgi:hypothetical protein